MHGRQKEPSKRNTPEELGANVNEVGYVRKAEGTVQAQRVHDTALAFGQFPRV
jgi:hypothetical protein